MLLNSVAFAMMHSFTVGMTMAQNFKYFGTDGIRGRVGEYPISNDFVVKLGWAIGRAFHKEDGAHPNVLIGKDTRISGYMFESALQAGLVSSGCDIRLCGPLATPGIAYLTRTFRADAGIVISASHNPYTDNGIKIFGGNGIKIDDLTQKRIESKLDKDMHCVPAIRLGKASRISDAVGRYVEFCKSAFPKTLSLKGMRIVLDCANGATYNTAPMVFSELGAEVIELGNEPDGFNINLECGSTSPQQAVEKVHKYRANLGIVLDGDGDRVVMIDAEGRLLDGDDLLYILIWSLCERDRLRGVVGTHMTNMALEHSCRELGVKFTRVDVGDRNIIRDLNRRGWNLGAEPSGHIICSDFATTGDGIISSLLVLAALQHHKLELRQACKKFRRHPQLLRSLSYQPHQREQIQRFITEQTPLAAERLGDKGRVLLRLSGTEPVLRIMVEAQEQLLADTTCSGIETAFHAALDENKTTSGGK